MLRLLPLLLLALLPLDALAWSNSSYTVGDFDHCGSMQEEPSGSQANANALAYAKLEAVLDADTVGYIRELEELGYQYTTAWGCDYVYKTRIAFSYAPRAELTEADIAEHLIYNHSYTDEQCQAFASSNSVFYGVTGDQAEAGFQSAGGACGIAAVSSTVACGTDDKGNWCAADWVGVSSGDPAQLDAGDTASSEAFTPPDYMTPVDPNDGICSTGSCVTIDGQTYHVDQSAIDDGSVSIIGGGDGDGGGDSGGGIEWGDGSGTATPGTSTDDDGDPLGMGDGTDDSTLGDVVGAIDSLKSSLRNGIEGLESSLREGFDGLVEGMSDSFSDSLTEFGNDLTDVGGLDGDGAVEGSLDGQGVTEDLAGTLEDEHGSVVDEKLEEYGEKIDSDGGVVGSALDAVRSLVTSYLPNLPSGGCSPVTFSFSGGAFTVDCEVFNIIKSALSFLMFFFTAYEITSIALSYRHSV